MSRPSLRDVAREAGTSTAVVSYVINGGPRPVAEATRRRVEAAIIKLGYRPNRVARSLRTRRTGTLGLVVADLSQAFFAQLADAVENAARASGQRLLVCSTRFDPQRELDQLRAMIDVQVDGIVLVPTRDVDAPLQVLEQAAVPTVVAHRHVHNQNWAGSSWQPLHVVGDDRGAGRQVAEHLLEHGHHRLACLTGPVEDSPVAQRTAGFRETVEERLPGFDDDLLISCGYEQLAYSAYRATLDTLTRRPDVTAICASTDGHALGAMRAAAEAGRTIGGDLAIISIDGTNATDYLTPSLTVVRAPFLDMGGQCVSMLTTMISGQSPEPGAALPLELVRRSSCGCRPDQTVVGQ